MSIKEAIEYGKRGWAVFPILPKSKAPACRSGFHDAVSEESDILALWNNRTNLNIGIATGEISGFWVLDIDTDKGGKETLDEWENKYGSLPETLTSNTGGGGKHYLFAIPRGQTIPSNANKIGRGIDIRGNGGYIAAPPSIHPSGNAYEWSDESSEIADPPAWLIRMILDLKKIPTTPPQSTSQFNGDWTQDDVISMLDCVSPDVDRLAWVNIGMALKEGGWPVTMFDTWSRGSQKYKMGEPFRIWNGFRNDGGITFGTLVHAAQDGGWEPKETIKESLDFSNVNGIDLSEFRSTLNGVLSVPREEKKQTKLEIGGLIGDTVAWINSNSNKLQPELAALHTICTLGAVFGRRYALQRLDTRTNLYVVALAESGQGKDNSRNCLPLLLSKAGLECFSGPENIRSDQGLMQELKKQPSFIANIDEFGMFMGAISDPKAAAYYKNISTLFTSIFGKSRTFYKDGITASMPENRIVLHEPNLCIYGTSTLGSYTQSMRRSSVESGKINRFIVFKTPISFPPKNPNSCHSDPPESLVSRWARFKPDGLESAPDIVEQDKTIVMMGDMEKEIDLLQDYQDIMQQKYHAQGIGDLWVRYRENVIKIAMILAIARDNKKPVLIESDVETGKTIVGSSLEFMINFAKDSMYDSDFQKKCAEFMEAVNSGATSRTSVIRRMGVKTKELDEVERALKEMGKIDYSEKDRPKTYTVLTKQ